MAQYRLVRVSKLFEAHGLLAVYLPKKATEALGWQKGDEVRVLMDEEERKLVIEKNEALVREG